ncbi:MAG: aminotransferase class I/II-fold pyridoxal phosphate-dependent enzyme, partial [Candidatus Eisenbacteria bacterium]|nr:aminotransferase class I/II-fold pyridoxal phosphate-dependent enzyme [Candidatus Eisenbacteria bacterium]
HSGAWGPRPEQIATAEFLESRSEIEAYHAEMKAGVRRRLDLLYEGMEALRHDGFPVQVIPPMGAIYLSVRFAVNGARTRDGETVTSNEDVRRYLLRRAGVAVVPFEAFGTSGEAGWFRMSVGAISEAACRDLFPRLREALRQLQG